MNAAEGVINELLKRGWKVTNVHEAGDKVTVAFELMSGRDPTWHKAVEIHPLLLSPDRVEAQMRAWQAKVIGDLAAGRPSEIVRKMIAEHGQEAVTAALCSPGSMVRAR